MDNKVLSFNETRNEINSLMQGLVRMMQAMDVTHEDRMASANFMRSQMFEVLMNPSQPEYETDYEALSLEMIKSCFELRDQAFRGGFRKVRSRSRNPHLLLVREPDPIPNPLN